MAGRLSFVMLAALIVLVMACVCCLSIWHMPSGRGPFSATHGPVTALRAWRAAMSLLCSICVLVAAALVARTTRALALARRELREILASPSAVPFSTLCTLRF